MGYKTTGPIQGTPSVRDIVAVKTLTVEDSGTVFMLNAGTGAAVTLPPVADSAGVYFKFILSQDSSGTDWTIVAQTAVIQGSGNQARLIVLFANETTISIELGVHTLGDWFEVYSDGTNWYANCQASVAATFTAV